MSIGQRRTRLIIEEKSLTQADDGSMVEAWVAVSALWVQIEHLRGREIVAAQQINSLINTRITGAFRPSITEEMRGVVDGDTGYYDFHAVYDPDYRRRTLEILAERKQFPADD